MTLGKIMASMLTAALLAWSFSGCSPEVTESEARSLAEQRIKEYAEKENLDPASFGQPVISAEPGHAWVFDYVNTAGPRHLVRIYVDSHEEVEIHRMIEE